MSRTQLQSWTVRGVDFTDVPMFGPEHVMARLAAGGLDVPRLDLATRPRASSPDAQNSAFQDRDRLADLLADFNSDVGNPLPESTLQAIRGEGVFVIAGQQPGLLLGPMYTLLKAVSAVAPARRLSERTGEEVIPAFWIASEDHDIEEVNRCFLSGQKFVVPHEELEHAGPRPPVGRLSLEPWRERVIGFVRDAMKGEPHGEWVVDLVESVRFESYSGMFAELMAKVVGRLGVVLIDPMRLRGLTGPVLAHMVEHWDALRAGFEEGTERVRSMGLNPPLDRVNLFRVGEEGRASVDDPRALEAEEIREHPERFSPGAALRPIVQDAILPTAATIAGPSELLYLWQIDPLYHAVGIQRSLPHPRFSATFIDSSAARRAERFDLGGERIFHVLESLEGESGDRLQNSEDLREIEALGDELLNRIDGLMDDGNRKPLGKSRESIEHQVGKVIDRVRQQRLEAAGVGRKRLERIADSVYPTGKLQERVSSPLELLGRFGPGMIEGIVGRLDPFIVKHWLVEEEVRDQKSEVRDQRSEVRDRVGNRDSDS